jgi:hypothetical protein
VALNFSAFLSKGEAKTPSKAYGSKSVTKFLLLQQNRGEILLAKQPIPVSPSVCCYSFLGVSTREEGG